VGGRVLRELPGAYRLLRHRTATLDQRTTVTSTKPARVLVTYSTAAGSTAGIAERIAQVLAAAGCTVQCLPASACSGRGGCRRPGRGQRRTRHGVADAFVRRVAPRGRLGPPAVWCFSVGGVRPHGRLTRALAALEVRRVGQRFPVDLRVRDHRLFGGVVELADVPLWGRLYFRMIGGKAGDRRDWAAVEAWAAASPIHSPSPGTCRRPAPVTPPRPVARTDHGPGGSR
jgi:menaquinone-dependent protoporphyrinogen oxidase